MTEIVKICKKHGELTIEQCVKRTDSRLSLRCIKCNNERSRKYYHQDKEKALDYKRRWRAKNKLLNPPIKKPKRERKIYHPETEGNVFQCRVHGWLTKEFLYFRKFDDSHWQPICKECQKKKALENFNKNKEKVLLRNKLKRINNPEEIRKRDKQNYLKNVDKLRKRSREYRNKNIEKVKIKQKIYREKNKESIYERNKKYISNNIEKVRERRKKYFARRKHHLKEKRREWALRNKDYLNKLNKKNRTTAIENLYDSYIRTILKMDRKGGKKRYSYMKGVEIPKDLIELKRTIILAKRKLKEKINDKDK
jgi:hypothetical protein